MDELERLQLDDRQTTDPIGRLTGVRSELLALVPTISGAAVAVLSGGHSDGELLSGSSCTSSATRSSTTTRSAARGISNVSDRGPALVCSAVIAGWTSLIAAAVVAVLLLLEFLRIGARPALTSGSGAY